MSSAEARALQIIGATRPELLSRCGAWCRELAAAADVERPNKLGTLAEASSLAGTGAVCAAVILAGEADDVAVALRIVRTTVGGITIGSAKVATDGLGLRDRRLWLDTMRAECGGTGVVLSQL